MTEQELQAIVEQAEARRGWEFVGDAKIQMVKGWCFHCGTNEQAQFILDAINAIPVLWAIIEQKSRALGEALRMLEARNGDIEDMGKELAELREEKRRLQIRLDEAEDFMVNDSNQAKILVELKEQTQALKAIKL